MANPTVRTNPLSTITDCLDQIARLRQRLKTVAHLQGIPAALALIDQIEDAVADVGFETELEQIEGH